MDPRFSRFMAALVVIFLLCSACGQDDQTSITIGVNAPLTGDIPQVGESTRFAAELWLSDVRAAGGLEIDGTRRLVRLIFRDNRSDPASAVEITSDFVMQNKVLVMVGPQSSQQAVPAGETANAGEMPMISPWSTNPATTLDRRWVFRTSFLDSFQGPVIANFVSQEFGFTKAAVLYDPGSEYPRGLANFFRQSWEESHGSIEAFETFSTGDTDFSEQLMKIIESGAEFLFLPQYYNEVAIIVKQAHALGWAAPIVGSDTWGSAELLNLCGDDCTGLYFSAHYTSTGATGATKDFIDRYEAEYGYVPDDVAALTWDTMLIVQQAIRDCGEITDNIVTDRTCVRDAMAQIRNFAGITGDMTFTEEGDPIKCAVIVRISEAGEFEFYEYACP